MKRLAVVIMFLVFCGAASAADTITFSGKLTVTSGGKEIAVDGQESIPLPETLRAETQDDDPGVMAGIFAEEGFAAKPAGITVRASGPFTVSGARVLGVFAVKGSGDGAKLEAVGGTKSPYTIPNDAGDCYILIKNSKKEDDEQEELGAAILLYVKLTVSSGGSGGSESGAVKTLNSKYFTFEIPDGWGGFEIDETSVYVERDDESASMEIEIDDLDGWKPDDLAEFYAKEHKAKDLKKDGSTYTFSYEEGGKINVASFGTSGGVYVLIIQTAKDKGGFEAIAKLRGAIKRK